LIPQLAIRGNTGCQKIAILMVLASQLAGCAVTDLKLTELNQSLVAEKYTGSLESSSGIETGSVNPSKPVANAVLPDSSKTALKQARQFKAERKLKEALAVLETIPNEDGSNHPLLIEQAMLALELGQTGKAQQLLNRTQPDNSKDWRVHSALGIAAASAGQQKDAQRLFAKALKLSPDNPTIMNNIALSLMLDQKPTEAETLLKRAQASKSHQARVTQNLALAQSLNGG
jgi:Flp pilus assembly protein TadD